MKRLEPVDGMTQQLDLGTVEHARQQDEAVVAQGLQVLLGRAVHQGLHKAEGQPWRNQSIKRANSSDWEFISSLR
ncbi:hypothetical protein D3C76_1188890 [compost metagenome]